MTRTMQVKKGTPLTNVMATLSELGEVQIQLPYDNLVFKKDTIVEYQLDGDSENKPTLN